MDEISTPLRVELPTSSNLNDIVTDRLASAPDAVLAEVPNAAGVWEPVTVAQFDARVVAVAKGLVAKGVQPGDPVAIMSRTRYEWTLLDFAIWAAGAVPVPVYETSSAEQVQWILTDAGVTLLFAETKGNAAVVEQVLAEAPSCREVLVIDDGGLDDVVAAGRDVPDEEIARRRALASLDDVATIIYTSGTTGRPKGAELTHRNFASLARNAVAFVPEVFTEGGRTLLFLPLAHVFARFIEVLALASGTVLGHAPDIKTLTTDLGSFRPTYILAVPRVFEKVYNSAEQKAATEGKGRIFHWAAATAIAWSRALDTPSGPSLWLTLQHKVADALVYSKLKAVLGGQARYAVSGGGPLGERLGHFYRGIGLKILEGYGLTESTAPTCVNLPERTRIGTVGLQLPGCAARIAPDGEILLRGHHIFRGYHGNAEATREAFDGEWFRTGDLGSLDDDGFLRITGRKKEIIVTAGGKNVAPAVLEDRIRAHALVSQCVVVGDGKPFIGALITLDPEGLPGWLTMQGKPAMTVDQAATDPDVLAALDAAVTRANAAVSRAESIRKFTVLTCDFTVENGYLTPSLKVKRNLVLKDYAQDVERLYAPGDDRDTLHTL
ncbi:AMP-dependent synthetase/ligase [Puerhibacterium puerhi]|uniref:AMP-dependent synthetase/ligase n=1 Tax=Puerhibacterium puerhi TaxID=2692623 RepID=UPI0013568814|nr:AMP-dependent synthetase/ligase [Puerhibacterium puerhi]